jgi:LmbE family N-acetylglucosaminyl deacetylase
MADVLIVAAHPDDEVLGVGGTVARLAEAGARVHLLIVAEGGTGREADHAAALRAAAGRAAHVLGARPPRFLGLPDQRLDTLPLIEVTRAIERVVAEVAPAAVYTHHGGDLNRDHQIVHEAALVACRPLPGAPVRRLYAFETVSSTEWGTPAFAPRHFVNVTGTLERKKAALAAYGAEMRPFPHARSWETVEALARRRGAEAGFAAAEAFEVLRSLDP